MTKNDLIAKQAIQLEDLKAENKHRRKVLNQARLMFIAVGAPLNDNVLQFTKEQLNWCRKVYQELENAG